MRKHKKRFVIVLLLCLGAAGIAILYGISREKKTRALSLIYIPKVEDGSNDFWTSLISGTRMAAEDYGVEITILAPDNETDVESQNEFLAQAIEEKPDAIIFTPISLTESNDLLDQAVQADIPITFIDSYTEEEVQSITVATDNLEAGKLLGEYARTFLDEGEEIAVVGHVQGASTAVEREEGFREGLGALSDNIVDVVFCDSDYEKAFDLTVELMEKYPDLKMIAGLNEYSFVGAARAVKAMGAEEQIMVLGVDSSQEAVSLMEEGIIRGIVVQKSYKMGYIGVRETVAMLRGEAYETNVDSGCELVTPENMYTSDIEKLIFPFDSDESQE
ncbi:MAG: substrate-binding domain-containing protein [Clostridiales bacterium]|nr:substrate-binding domain-containing protein [Clostridiales bacterium]